MKTTETQAVLHIALMAGFADGAKHEREREAIRSIAESLGNDPAVNLPSLYQDVLLERVSLADAAAALESEEARQLAYEMAVCLCDADGVHSSAEHAFLQQLQQQLGLAKAPNMAFVEQADTLAVAAVPVVASAAANAPASSTPPPLTVIDRGELEAQIRTAAITNGALELLPETLSTMAIIPLQMRLVYRIGKAHGYELDSGHIKDFLATLGVGLTSQYLESAGRKLVGGLLRKVGGRKVGGRMVGGVLGGIGKQAISSGMSFASTYALGNVALEYYAGGRKLSTDVLKNTYQRLFGQGQQLQTQLRPQIEQRAQTLDMGEIMQMVRGKVM